MHGMLLFVYIRFEIPSSEWFPVCVTLCAQLTSTLQFWSNRTCTQNCIRDELIFFFLSKVNQSTVNSFISTKFHTIPHRVFLVVDFVALRFLGNHDSDCQFVFLVCMLICRTQNNPKMMDSI